jgi:CRP-like cAMP-binding protein
MYRLNNYGVSVTVKTFGRCRAVKEFVARGPDIRDSAQRNSILRRLSAGHAEKRFSGFSLTSLAARRTLWRQNATIQNVYFPLTAVVSIIVSTSAGELMEVGTVGNEGVVGVPISMGVNRGIGRALVQFPGEAIVISAARFRDLTAGDPAMALIVNRYTYFFVRLVVQTSLCYRFHSADERCARWLLGVQDRAGTDEFAFTQDFLALMMGTRRPKANLAMATLRRAGAIDYGYGRIAILDRGALESFSCPCYETMRQLRSDLHL